MKYRYPGVVPFTRSDEALFFGRDDDSERLYRLIGLEQMVVLYGKSGYGKSSLLQAAILPRIESELKHITLTVRFTAYQPPKSNGSGNTAIMPAARVVETVQHWLLENRYTLSEDSYLDRLIKQENSLWYWFKKLQEATGGTTRVLLAFDQFEEFFTYPERAQLQLRYQLAELLFLQIPLNFRNRQSRDEYMHVLSPAERELFFEPMNIRVVFSIRSDYMHLMNRLKDYLPQILRHCFELDALNREQAHDAIVQPARLAGAEWFSPTFDYTPAALDLLLNFLSDDGTDKIESFQLQLICRHIENEIVIDQNYRDIEAGNFGETPDQQRSYLEDINRQYYNSCIEKIPPEQQAVARLIVEDELVTMEDHRRITADGGMLVSRYRDRGASLDLLELLKNTYLIRAENTARGTAYELSHDALVEPIVEAKVTREEVEKRAARKAIFLRERRRRQTATVIAVIGFLLAFLAGGAAWYAFQQRA
ncbi:MAG: hypothetical protein ABIQ93_08035, partial [Saprospiraceae bacterium]